MEKQILSPALNGHYELIGVRPIKVRLPHDMGGNEVDFRTMTLEEAKRLQENGCTYLVPVAKVKAEAPNKKEKNPAE